MADSFGEGRRRSYKRDDIKAVHGGHELFRIGGRQLRSMSVTELAFWSLSSTSERHRIACIATLLSEIGCGKDVREVLNSLEVRKEDNAAKATSQNG